MKSLASIHGNGMVGSLVQMALLVLLVLAGACLYVPLHLQRQLKDKLEAARTELSELEVLHPLYVELAMLDKPGKWPVLAIPPSRKLSERDIKSVPESFMQMATNCLIELSTVSPRVQADEAGGRHLGVELHATGPYPQIKAFLLALVQMPGLERIERLEIRREALQEQFHVAVRMALE